MPSLSKYFIENENIGLYEEIFDNVHIIDSHVHIGLDREGQRLNRLSLLKQMRGNGIDKAIVFPFDDPRAGKDYNYPNERILEAFHKDPTTLVPFFRLSPKNDWKQEYERRAAQGFQGIKLHPRSQNFGMTCPEVMELYERMEKDNLITLIHAGFGLDYMADDLLKIARTFPKLRIIVGHGGFPELERVIQLLKDKDNVAFETSTMRIFDLVELISNVSYKKIFFGSDAPIYDQTLALQMLVDSAALAKQKPNQIKSMLGENVQRWLR